MGIVKYDVSGVEAGSTGVAIKPGVYKFKVVEAKDRRPDKNDIQVVLEITAGKYKGERIWTWVNFGEASQWKLAEFVRALGLKEKGQFNTDKLVGKVLAALTDRRPWEGEERNGIKTFMPVESMEDEEDESDDDLDDDEVDDDEADDEADDEEEDEDEEDEEEEESEDLDDMSRSDLKALIADRGLDIKVTKKMSDDDIRDAIRESDGEDESDDEDDEDDEAEDYSKWDDDELREELESRGLSVKGKTPTLIKRLEKDDAAAKPF